MVQKIQTFLTSRIIDKYHISVKTVNADIIAGLTVALILIPQSLAYAQLAGLPPHYGLYSSFLPLVFATIFGSSRFLATGPVAMISLITGSALSSLSISTPEEMVMYAVLLALMVGIIQISLGLLKMGVIVNFVSHPVIIGFTNAAAIIIATSQLPKVFGVSTDTYEHHYQTVYRFLTSALTYIHWQSVGIALIALLIMIFGKKHFPRLPAILAAIVICTIISINIDFEQKSTVPFERIHSNNLKRSISTYNSLVHSKRRLESDKKGLLTRKMMIEKKHGITLESLEVGASVEAISLEMEEVSSLQQSYREHIRSYKLIESVNNSKQISYSQYNGFAWNPMLTIWKVQVGSGTIDTRLITMTTGGSILGTVPAGLPPIKLPKIDLTSIPHLINAAYVIAVLGFMESIAVARSLAMRVGDRVDPNRELVGQGLANIAGSFSLSYPVAGSFSRTAVNYNAGAQTKYASFFTVIFVLLTLLFFTPWLYHIPQPVLAAIIIFSVSGLINFEKIIAAWHTHRSDGFIAIATFVSTLFFAPHLDQGILLGVLLSTGYYIYTRTRPQIVQLSADKHNILHDIKLHRLRPCSNIVIVRFDGSLFFANAAYFENKLDNIINRHPQQIKAVVLLAGGINYIDYSGIETLAVIATRLNDSGKIFIISNMKTHILNVVKKSKEMKTIGVNNFIQREREAIASIYVQAHSNSIENKCPLTGYVHAMRHVAKISEVQ